MDRRYILEQLSRWELAKYCDYLVNYINGMKEMKAEDIQANGIKTASLMRRTGECKDTFTTQ